MTHRFELIIEDTHGIVTDQSDAAFDVFTDAISDAGCDDSTPGIFCGIVTNGFSRELTSLEEAIRSAIADVQSAGYRATAVRMEPSAIVDRINRQLADTSFQHSSLVNRNTRSG